MQFVVENIDQLDLSAMTRAYRGAGSASYHPSLLLGLMIYGYATGVFSSRKLQRATHDSVAFRFIAANQHPDHDTLLNTKRLSIKPGRPGARNMNSAPANRLLPPALDRTPKIKSTSPMMSHAS